MLDSIKVSLTNLKTYMTYLCIMIKAIARLLVLVIFLIVPRLTGQNINVNLSKSYCSYVPEMNLDNVYQEILFNKIKHPNIVLRQVIIETRWLKCKNCSMKFNNLFGFTTRNGYMKFKNWTESIAYYKKWQNRVGVDEIEDYYAVLKRAHFSTGEKYNSHLKSIDINCFIENFEATNSVIE